MGYSIYRIGNGRWGGYGVPAICEYPGCDKEIDRGMSYACGGEPFSELGCDRYFCSKHLIWTGFKRDGSDERCDHELGDKKCKCEFKEVCERCSKGEDPFPYKKEHPRFLYHLIHDYSWAEWRKENPERVEEMKKEIGDYKPPTDDDDTQEIEPKEE